MKTQDQTTLMMDDFLIGPQSDEFTFFGIDGEEVVKSVSPSRRAVRGIARLCWGATKSSARVAYRIGSFGTHQVTGVLNAIRWASRPSGKKAPIPGLMLEFVLLGIHVAVGAATLLVA